MCCTLGSCQTQRRAVAVRHPPAQWLAALALAGVGFFVNPTVRAGLTATGPATIAQNTPLQVLEHYFATPLQGGGDIVMGTGVTTGRMDDSKDQFRSGPIPSANFNVSTSGGSAAGTTSPPFDLPSAVGNSASSVPARNDDARDHLITYAITSSASGSSAGADSWLLFWEVSPQHSSDPDSNDPAAQVDAGPAPAAEEAPTLLIPAPAALESGLVTLLLVGAWSRLRPFRRWLV